MSKTNETEKLEKEVVVNETEENTELTVPQEGETGEVKESKLKKAGKIALKVAALAGAGIVGFILGTKTSSKSEATEVEYEVSDGPTDIEEN